MKLVQAITLANNQLAQEANYLVDTANAIMGTPGLGPRYEIPQPIVYQGQCVTRNINVNQATVGVINTGNVGRIDAAIGFLAGTQQQELVGALKTFTEAVLNEPSLEAKIKNEVIEYLSYLASELTVPKESRRKAICKAALEAIGKLVSTISKLFALWEKVAPIIRTALLS
ncbi:MAG: hypothetical protein HPY55_16025 [Firmicutes bacterium]|nr:hypothetical protein [Bacillota bacterium]